MKKILLAGGAMLAVIGLSSVAFSAQAPFTLSSTTFKDGTMMPQKVATQTPFLKLNSFTLAVFSLWGSSFSFAIPANPLIETV